MKIGNTSAPAGINPTGAATTSSRPAGEGGAVQGTASANKADGSATVELSSTARALMEAADGSFDAHKVEQVRQSISDGTYKINADAIADKLIANAREVLGKVGPTGH
ncbi:flagellar biosynthesis anti-sigma factor FlgM [Sphaerotilus mobilis]|uniref:Negative regulator of flagellin synthesis n=1 Tax=Sphaerotilus mobilis TaxID=47994 RepID=A0A4Q7LSH5_9BURK|nr:flagellar biosynthesis anti-sigma factor FlgM [Sphaerotilus mobilis]RZS57267.1 FlgM family anti-sigma-28 factor [Sphaerotilus mobilis]